MRLHICWGNYEGPHTRDISLKAVLPELLKAKPGALTFGSSGAGGASHLADPASRVKP